MSFFKKKRTATPSLMDHQQLMIHDRVHGEQWPKMGKHLHWAHSWWIQKNRQWEEFDVMVVGANPVLGALLCLKYAQKGMKVLWCCYPGKDLWDYPLTLNGTHNDVFKEKNWPGVSAELFKKIGAACQGRVTMLKGWEIQYEWKTESAHSLFFLTPCQEEGSYGPARDQLTQWIDEGFKCCSELNVKNKPFHQGGGAKDVVVKVPLLAMNSDWKNGEDRDKEIKRPASERDIVGRARWHTENPWTFALESRLDLEMILKEVKNNG